MSGANAVDIVEGVRLYPGWLDAEAQAALLAEIEAVVREAPLYKPRMPNSGAPFSVSMTNCGALGWFSDENGYRYVDKHPETGRPWPPIPGAARSAWTELSNCPHEPEACLVNWYAPEARMGLHQDRDEQDLGAPVVSLSLGDDAIFRLGGLRRKESDALVPLVFRRRLILAPPARLAFHGVDRICPSWARLDMAPGRFNLTLRRVSAAPSMRS